MCKIKSMKSEERKLKHLSILFYFIQEIHLADNQLTEITDAQLENLLSLISLNVRGNKIKVLPEQIALLPNLERLDVTNNDLAE